MSQVEAKEKIGLHPLANHKATVGYKKDSVYSWCWLQDSKRNHLKYFEERGENINEIIQDFNDKILYGIPIMRDSDLYIQEKFAQTELVGQKGV